MKEYAALSPDALKARFEAISGTLASKEPTLRALLPGTADAAAIAKRVDALLDRWPDEADRGALFGLALGVKDIIHVDGFPTRCGTLLPSELFGGEQAECVTRLLDAGMLLVGKTETTEFASLDPGPTRNPHDPGRTPGGSSSGSAAGVAARYFDVALGTQTIGSVIRPAAYCGVVGFKPSLARISNTGIVPFSKTMDQVGFFCHDTRTTAATAAVLVDGWSPAQAIDLAGMRICVPEGAYLAQATPHGIAEFELTVKRLRAAGIDVEAVPALAQIERINLDHQRLVAAELARVHAPWFEEHRHLYRPKTLGVIEPGFAIDDQELAELRRRQPENRAAMIDEMERYGVELWLCPAAVDQAPRGIEATGNPIMNLPWTHAGLPVISLPSHLDADRLPHGLQVVGRPGADESLLAAAAGIERLLDYRSPLL